MKAKYVAAWRGLTSQRAHRRQSSAWRREGKAAIGVYISKIMRRNGVAARLVRGGNEE